MKSTTRVVVAALAAAAISAGTAVVGVAGLGPDTRSPAAAAVGEEGPTPAGALDRAQRRVLRQMAQEEKLAHDLYVAFDGKYRDRRFFRIANSEVTHLNALRAMMTVYDVTDPTEGMADGEFSAQSWQDLYTALVAKGSSGLTSALKVAANAERRDIADLTAAIKALGDDAPDVESVYRHLRRGSRIHLEAFTR